MFKKLKQLFFRPPKAPTRSEELLRQALLSRDLMCSLEKARKSNTPILVQISAPGRSHAFSLPGQHEAAAWLYDLAAGYWHANLTESRTAFEEEAALRQKEAEERLLPRREEEVCDYDA
jgi:hypothetical protein